MHLNSAKTLLLTYIQNDIPAMMHGAPGVGKSSIVREIADEAFGGNLIDFRASTRDPVALMGLPDLEGDTTKWRVPDEFPQVERDGAEGILFLDEINAAPPSMMAALFGLVLDRKVGNYTLPPGWRIIAAGNRQSDRAAAQRMPSALANRFAHIDVDADLDTTIAYLDRIDSDPLLIAFLRWRPALLHNMDVPDLRAFPTPRSWVQVSKVLHLPHDLRLQAAFGLVGEGAASELEQFLRVYKDLPTIEQVLDKPESTKVPDAMAAKYAIATALARRCDEKTFANAMTYVSRLGREMEIMFTVDAVKRQPALAQTKTFIAWSTRNIDIVIG